MLQIEALQEVLKKLKSKRIPIYEKKYGQVPMVRLRGHPSPCVSTRKCIPLTLRHQLLPRMWLFIQIMGLQSSVGSPFASTVSTLSSWSLKIRVDWPFRNIEQLVPGICPWVSVESSIS